MCIYIYIYIYEGYVSLDRQKVYFFGIIDVLERYSLRWRLQHACLTAGYWPSGERLVKITLGM